MRALVRLALVLAALAVICIAIAWLAVRSGAEATP